MFFCLANLISVIRACKIPKCSVQQIFRACGFDGLQQKLLQEIKAISTHELYQTIHNLVVRREAVI